MMTAPVFILPAGVCGIPPKPGITMQIAAYTPDGNLHVTAPLAIVAQPKVETDPQGYQLPRNANIIPVRGSDWVPGSAVSIVAATPPDPKDCHISTPFDWVRCLAPLPSAQPVSIVADADGAFGTTVPLPPNLEPGKQVTLRAAVSGPPYGTLVFQADWAGTILPPVAPTFALSSTSGLAGAILTVSGDHWPAGQTVIVEYCRSEAVSNVFDVPRCNQFVGTGYAAELGRTTADNSGHFAIPVTLPSNARLGAIMFQTRVDGESPEMGVYYGQAAFTIIPLSNRPSRWCPWFSGRSSWAVRSSCWRLPGWCSGGAAGCARS
jgi:hypothetical protein